MTGENKEKKKWKLETEFMKDATEGNGYTAERNIKEVVLNVKIHC
jgi:hypothetical protein